MPPFICHTLILARVRSSPRNSLCCFNSPMFFLGLVRALTHTAWSTPRVYPCLPKRFKRHPSSAHTPLCAPSSQPGAGWWEDAGWKQQHRRGAGCADGRPGKVSPRAAPANWLLQSGIPGGLPDGETFSAAELQAVLLGKLEAVTLSLFLHIPCCFQTSFDAYT